MIKNPLNRVDFHGEASTKPILLNLCFPECLCGTSLSAFLVLSDVLYRRLLSVPDLLVSRRRACIRALVASRRVFL